MKRFLLAIGLAACGGKGTTAETPAPAAATAPAPVPAAEPACVAVCGDQYPGALDDAGYRGYCDEVCTPPETPSAQCLSSCEQSHEPGAHYDGSGEYVTDEDTRTDQQKQADREGCEDECAEVPVISDETMAACVRMCTAVGRAESLCQAECDPDPYDQCRYAPCD